MLAPLPLDEEERLFELSCFGVMDTAPEAAFDRITRLAAQVSMRPSPWLPWWTATGSGSNRVSGSTSTRRRAANRSARTPSWSPAAWSCPTRAMDERFAEHPLVVGEPFIRFYAGAPLTTPRGFRLGTLCILDTVAREFGPKEVAMLEDLAAIVVAELELRWDARPQPARDRTPPPGGPLGARRPRRTPGPRP